MKDFNYQLNHANLLKVESEPDLPVSSDENMQTYKGKLKFSDTVNTFIQAIMSSDSFKFSSIPLQQQIQHLSFIINMWTISSSEYLLDIITEEHVKLMVCVECIYNNHFDQRFQSNLFTGSDQNWSCVLGQWSAIQRLGTKCSDEIQER